MGSLTRNAATGGAALPDYFGRGWGGQDNAGIAAQLQVSRPTVQLWRKRVLEQGIGAVWKIAPGRGRKAAIRSSHARAIIEATLRTKPAGMSHWSCRLMAAAQEVSKSTVNRLWRLHNTEKICQEDANSVMLCEIKVDPSKPLFRGRFQTATSCYGPIAAVANVVVERRDCTSCGNEGDECKRIADDASKMP
jgi:hypothetical protein